MARPSLCRVGANYQATECRHEFLRFGHSCLTLRRPDRLQENYEVGCRESIAKEDVYHHYVAHCQAEGTEPLRASMFGKLVHRAFPGLKSSRIGTRGATRHSYKSFRARPTPCHPRPLPREAMSARARPEGQENLNCQ